LRLIDNLRTQLSIADSRLKQINPGARGRLITPLAHARQRFLADLTKAHRQLTDGLDQTGALRSLLAGPRRYLVLAGNNAEMRSGGITTVTSAASIEGGDVRVGRFIQSENLLLPDGKGVPVPPDLVHLYQWISVGQEWRTTETSPNWPIVASIYAQMAARSPIGPVDGVIFVDMVTLRSLLDVVGPVNVNGVTYTADNVYDELLYRNYLRFSTGAEANARHEAQSEVAAAIFEVLRTRPFSLARLAHELSHNAKGRHVLAWSSHPDEEAMWVKSGASGALCANCFMISPQNVSASKLDYFIDPRAAMRVEHYSEHQEVNLSVTISNAHRVKTSPYIEGGVSGYNRPGDQRVYLLLYLPASAYNVINPSPGFMTIGTDGPMGVVGMMFIVPNGQTRTVDIHFLLPLSQRAVYLLPSSRLRPIQITVNGAHYNDAVPTAIPF